jgi:hypothetical protein
VIPLPCPPLNKPIVVAFIAKLHVAPLSEEYPILVFGEPVLNPTATNKPFP